MRRRYLGMRRVLPVASLLVLHPVLAAAQTNVDGHVGAPCNSQATPVETAVARVTFQFDLARRLDARVTPIDMAMFGAEFHTAGHPRPRGSNPDWLRAAMAKGARRTLSGYTTGRPSSGEQPAGRQQRSWRGRHPVLFGALVGFGGGFVIGYASGRDGVFDDQDAAFSAWVLGGVGAGAGALVGVIVRATRD